MSDKTKTILLRFLRVGAAGVVAYVIAWLAGPDVTELLGAERAVLLAAVLTPLLAALEKALRYGADPGEA